MKIVEVIGSPHGVKGNTGLLSSQVLEAAEGLGHAPSATAAGPINRNTLAKNHPSLDEKRFYGPRPDSLAAC